MDKMYDVRSLTLFCLFVRSSEYSLVSVVADLFVRANTTIAMAQMEWRDDARANSC